ncbi:DUF1330 domain-containing protein [Bradyrhizobium sp. CW9]|nr:DUF1330 domain-containing protein [Bradyrhizobium sp. CW9]
MREWNNEEACWIGRIDVHNRDGFQHYGAANPAIIKKFGGRFVVRSGKFELKPEWQFRQQPKSLPP